MRRRLVPAVLAAAFLLVGASLGRAAAVPPTDQPCVVEPCELPFDAKAPPATARSPRATLSISVDPFKVELDASGLGPPSGWVSGGDADAASSYALYIFERDDSTSAGGRLCILDADLDCTADEIPRPGISSTYRRITLMAISDVGSDPTPTEAAARVVATRAFDPPLEIAAGEAGAPSTATSATAAPARTGPATTSYLALTAAGLIVLGWGLTTRQRKRGAKPA